MEDRIARLKRIVNLAPPATSPIAVYLESATEIHADEGTTSIAPQLNLAKTNASVSSGGYLGGPLKGQIVGVDWYFLWTPPRDGLLNVTTFLQMTGGSSLIVNSDCNGGSASSQVDAGVQLTQLNEQGQPHSDQQGGTELELFLQQEAFDSVGAVQFNSLDETDTVGHRAFNFPTAGGIPLLITVWTYLYVLVRNATAELDFESGDYRLNVPFVFLLLS